MNENFWYIFFIYALFLVLSYTRKGKAVFAVTSIIGLVLSLILLADVTPEIKLLGIATIFFNVYLMYQAIFEGT